MNNDIIRGTVITAYVRHNIGNCKYTGRLTCLIGLRLT